MEKPDEEVVLLVEDDEDVQQDLAFLIEHRGHRVEIAANGREALDKLEAMGRPCLIILDLMMPVMDGWQVRAELLKCRALAEVPVVLLSGVADLQKQARQLQAIDYLSKPVRLERLYGLLDALC